MPRRPDELSSTPVSPDFISGDGTKISPVAHVVQEIRYQDENGIIEVIQLLRKVDILKPTNQINSTTLEIA